VVSVEAKPLARLAQGDFFGEMAILGDGRRTATETSTSPTRLLVMFGTEFRRLEAEFPEIASRMSELVQTRGRRARRAGLTEPRAHGTLLDLAVLAIMDDEGGNRRMVEHGVRHRAEDC
jgi:CRP-like cAMP-binding protein